MTDEQRSATSMRTTPAEVQMQRDQLRDAMSALEQALAQPSIGRLEAWGAKLDEATARLGDALRRHNEVTEGDDGLFAQVVSMAPRFQHAVQELHSEHETIDQQFRELLNASAALAAGRSSSSDEARDRGTQMLTLLARHRQRGIELTYRAFSDDLGSAG